LGWHSSRKDSTSFKTFPNALLGLSALSMTVSFRPLNQYEISFGKAKREKRRPTRMPNFLPSLVVLAPRCGANRATCDLQTVAMCSRSAYMSVPAKVTGT